MTIKTHWETIDKERCFTFFAEDRETNTCIHSSTYICNREGKKLYPKLKAEFTTQIMEIQIKEKIMIESKVHELIKNDKVLDLNELIK
jgi:hypothetical protein